MPTIYIEKNLTTNCQVWTWILYETHEENNSYFHWITVSEDVLEILKSDSELWYDLALKIAADNS